MLLAIDSGNTNIVFGLYQGPKQISQWRLMNEPQRPADEYIIFLTQWMSLEGYSLDSIEDVIISSVVPEALFHLKGMAKRYFKNEPFVVGEPTVDIRMVIKIDKPESLGADLLVNAYGAYRRYGGPLIIIDFGTATTFEVIDGEGNFRGGSIASGINLTLKALYEAAAKLPSIAFARTNHVIATETKAAMQAGTYWGYIGMVKELIERTNQEYVKNYGPADLKVVATGGLCTLVTQDLPLIHHVDENLLLDSLAEIYSEVCVEKKEDTR
jgi:type III pantothenate kinase